VQTKSYSPDIQVELTPGDDPEYTYLLKDHLGSTVLAIDSSRNAPKPARFDPWGMQVNAAGIEVSLDNVKEVEQTRGFTGHETIASAGISPYEQSRL